MSENNENIEILTTEEDVEILSLDDVVSDKIEEMLDFFDTTPNIAEKKDIKEELDNLLEDVKDEKNINIYTDASSDALDEFKPSIKDFNIKNAKTKKIVKKSMLYIIIVMLLGFEFFITQSGKVLNEIRVYASNNVPIKIVQNEKYGYIDYTGNKIVNPKYIYAEDFINGYAIVKDSSNLPLIIDKGGKEVVPTGNYFSIYRAENDIVASKVTKKGLKYGVLDENLKKKIDFEYDSISYVDDLYSYVKGNNVGLINNKGKEIFKYKLTDNQDKTISVSASKVTNDSYVRYAVVKINSSSQIVNLEDGTIVSKPTLNEIVSEENNIFYEIISSGKKRYIYVENNKVLVESDSYISLKMNDIQTGILKALTSSYTYEYISTKTLEQIKKGLTDKEVYYGNNVFIYKEYNYKKNKTVINMIKKGEVFKSLEEDFEIYKEFVNGIAIVKYSDNTFGYINEEGNLITDIHFMEAGVFDDYGEAVAKTDKGYGVINKEGKIIVSFTYDEIKMASSFVKKKSTANNNNVFYVAKKDNGYYLLNKKGKKYDKTVYNEVILNEEYPILKVATDANDLIIIPDKKASINLTSFNSEYKAYDNYIIVKNEYYNYKGKLIYTDNSIKES